MKKILYLTLEVNSETVKVLEEIKNDGYNATMISSGSLHHAFDVLPEERHFFSLRHVESVKNNESVLGLFVIDEDKLEHLKEVIRKNTDNFKKIKGFMFSRDIQDYEGSI